MSEINASVVVQDGLWNDLPDLVIAHVFSFLTLNDRITASLVCKSWSKGFESPNLWRNVDIWLPVKPADEDKSKEDFSIIETLAVVNACRRKELEVRMKQKDKLQKIREKLEAKKLDEDEDEDEDDNDSKNNTNKQEKFLSKKERLMKTIPSRLIFDYEKALMFSDSYGYYLKSLRLMCNPGPKDLFREIRFQVSQFLKKLVQRCCVLNELIIYFSYNGEEWDEDERKDLMDDFSEFLVSQQEIETLVFGDYLFTKEVKLLEAVVEGSGGTIKNFHCLLHNEDECNDGHLETYCKILGYLPNLQFLSMSFHLLNDKVITTLNNCKTLQTVYLFDLLRNQNLRWNLVSPVSEIDWKAPLKILPEIGKHFGGEFWLKCSESTRAVPLKACHYLSRQFHYPNDEDATVEFLKFLRLKFPRNLVSLTIEGDFYKNKLIEEEVGKLMMSFTALKDLKLKSNVPFNLFEEIYMLQFQDKIDLQFFWCRCCSDCVTEDLNKLITLIDLYEVDRNWILEVFEWRYILSKIARRLMNEERGIFNSE